MQPSLETAVRRLQALSQTLQRNLAMNSHLRRSLSALVAFVSVATFGVASWAANLTWTGSADNVWDINTTANWGGDASVFNNGDSVTFSGGSNTTPIAISGVVIPGAVDVTTTGGPFDFSGGILRYNYNTSVTSLSFGAGTLGLDGATLHLNFLGNSWGQTLNYTSPLAIRSGGGTIDLGPDGGGQRRSKVTFSNSLQLDGSLTIVGNSFANTLVNPPQFSGPITLSGNRQILNDTTNAPTTIELAGPLAGNTHTLTLASNTGGSFTLINPAATSLDVRTIQANADLLQFRNGGVAAYDPLDRLVANGGGLIMGTGRTYTITGQSGFGIQFRPSNVTWQGNNTLALIGNNWNSDFTVLGNLGVGGAGNNLLTLNYQPFRGGLTMTTGTALTVGDGGLFRTTVARDDGIERTNGNLVFLHGAVIEGVNTAGTLRGGLVRNNAGTLTLGDGSASTITIRGNTAAKTQFFAIGYDSFVTDAGNVTLRYESTGVAGQSFNVAWTPGGNTRANAVAFRGGSAGTVFAPGAASISVVGPDTGEVFVASTPASLVTTGTVGFYNGAAGADDASRGALGPVRVAATGSFALLEAGLMQASALTTISGSTLSGIGTFDVPTIAVGGSVEPGNGIGTLTMGTLLNPTTVTFASGGELVIEMQGDGTAGLDYDVLVVNGNVVFESGAVLTLDYLGGYTPGAVSSWDILQATGSVTGFGLLELPAKHVLSFSDGVLTLTLIPEPTAGLLLACGGLFALRRRQRRG